MEREPTTAERIGQHVENREYEPLAGLLKVLGGQRELTAQQVANEVHLAIHGVGDLESTWHDQFLNTPE